MYTYMENQPTIHSYVTFWEYWSAQFSDQFLDQFGKTPELVWIGPETDSRPKNQKLVSKNNWSGIGQEIGPTQIFPNMYNWLV